jgi:hypothetical protein
MVPNITTILPRFTGEWAMRLPPEALLTICREIGYTAWRDRVLTPVTTVQLFLWQMLHGHTACSHLPHLAGLRCRAAASCQARARLPLCFFDLLLERFGRAVQRSPWTKGGGKAIAPVLSRARDVPCPIPRPCRPPSASRRRSGLGVAFPSPGSWGYSMRAPVGS